MCQERLYEAINGLLFRYSNFYINHLLYIWNLLVKYELSAPYDFFYIILKNKKNEKVKEFVEYFNKNNNLEEFLNRSIDYGIKFKFFIFACNDYFIEHCREEKIKKNVSPDLFIEIYEIYISRLLEEPFINPDRNNYIHYSINDTWNYIKGIWEKIHFEQRPILKNLYLKFFLVAWTVRPTEPIKLETWYEKETYKKFIQLKVIDTRKSNNKRLQLRDQNPFNDSDKSFLPLKSLSKFLEESYKRKILTKKNKSIDEENKIVELPDEIIRHISTYLFGRKSKRKY